MKDKIIEWANNEDHIRAVILIGSRARDLQPDALADYDISIFTHNALIYTQDDLWLSKIGKAWICVHENVLWKEKRYPSRLVIFEDGIKGDFTFYPMDVLNEIIESSTLPEHYRLGYNVWVDKDHLTARMPKPSRVMTRTRKPSEEEFIRIVNEFWFEAYHVGVYLKRGALWQAKYRAGGIYDHFLLKMIEWNELAKVNFDKDIPPMGKRMQEWVGKNTWDSLYQVFGHFDSEDSWKALLKTIELFRELAVDTAKRMGYRYPKDVDLNISKFIGSLKRNK